ncbi:MAG TPA: hypothetical protein VKT51_05130 [Candidatus Eremiobacteraceae bacterium]|nr:hypothetical protein [Candidatus Eremiobacteraceae bacterium]
MSKKTGIAAILMAFGLLVSVGLYAKTQAARADGGASADASCISTNPCLGENNTSSGPGVKSSSSRGNGLIATTKATGSTSLNGRSALLGEDLQTASGAGLFNFGVSGTSTNGTGVMGSGAIGVMGSTPNATGGIGFLAKTLDNNNTGAILFEGLDYTSPVFSVDTNGGAQFGDTRPGYATGSVTVTAYAGNNTPMFAAKTGNGTIFQVLSGGAVEVPGSIFVNSIGSYGSSPVTFTSATTFNDGLQSYGLDATNNGVSSTQDGTFSGPNILASDASGVVWLYQGYSTTAGKYTIQMGDSGSIYARIFITTGASKVAQQTSAGTRVDTYAPQAAQPSLEDFGEAQLDGGVADIPLDPRFAAAMDTTTRYFVTLTPEGDCRGLYVARRDASGFIVRELQGGRSSIAFTYRIVAKPLGNDSPRLAPSALPYGFDHKVPPPAIRFPARSPRRAPQT